MHRDSVLNKIELYRRTTPEQSEVAQTFIDFIQSNSNCFERTNLKGHLTGSCWLLNTKGDKALLTHHKKLGKWLQLGGHADGDYDIMNVALKEAQEESGIDNIRPIIEEIFDLDAHIIPARKNEPEHIHYDVRFLLRCTDNDNFSVSDESHDLAWLSFDELKSVESDDSVHRMARKWKSIFQN